MQFLYFLCKMFMYWTFFYKEFIYSSIYLLGKGNNPDKANNPCNGGAIHSELHRK